MNDKPTKDTGAQAYAPIGRSESDTPTPEAIERAIIEIADAARKLMSTRLTDKAVVLLLSHASGVAQRDVRAVLEHAKALDRTYLKPTPKAGGKP